MRENTNQNNSEYGHFLRSDSSDANSNIFVILPLRDCQAFFIVLQKQPTRGVFKKTSSENMPQICRITPMPKWDFKKNTSGQLLLVLSTFSLCQLC